MANLFLLSRKAFVMCSCFRASLKTFFFDPALVSGPPNRKKPFNKHIISLVFSVRTVNYGSSFRNLQYGPKTRLIRSAYSLRSRPKKERARERETREGRGKACPEGPRKSFQLAFCEYGYFQLVERLPREKLTALGEKTVNQ